MVLLVEYSPAFVSAQTGFQNKTQHVRTSAFLNGGNQPPPRTPAVTMEGLPENIVRGRPSLKPSVIVGMTRRRTDSPTARPADRLVDSRTFGRFRSPPMRHLLRPIEDGGGLLTLLPIALDAAAKTIAAAATLASDRRSCAELLLEEP